MRGVPVFVVVLAAAGGLTACLAGVRTIPLHYPPHAATADSVRERVMQPQSALTIEETGVVRAPPTVVIGPFEDQRRWTRIGENRSSWNLHLTRFEPETPVDGWLRDGLIHELTRRGITVSRAEQAGDGEMERGTLLIDGRIRTAFTSRRFYHEARLRFTAFVRCAEHRRILDTRIYDEVASLDHDVEDGHAEALSRLLRRAALDLAEAASVRTVCDS